MSGQRSSKSGTSDQSFNSGVPSLAAKILLTEPEAVDQTGLCAKSLYNARRAGHLPYVKIGSAIRYLPADLKAWAESHRRSGGA